jgi:hypothetical protein
MIRLTSIHTAFGITLGIIFGILFGITASSVIAWSNPTATPPGGNVSGSPLTTGNWQTKLQGLVLNNSATPSALGLWVARGGVTIGTSSLPASFANQGLAVNGKVAASEYCDENGENCSTPPFGGGEGGEYSFSAETSLTGVITQNIGPTSYIAFTTNLYDAIVIDLGNELFDNGDVFDHTTHTFTAPTDGRYQFNGYVVGTPRQVTGGSAGDFWGGLFHNGNMKAGGMVCNGHDDVLDSDDVTAQPGNRAQFSCTVDLDAGDTLMLGVAFSGIGHHTLWGGLDGFLISGGGEGGVGAGGTDTLANLSCSTDQIAKYNGSEWVCADQYKVGDSVACGFVAGTGGTAPNPPCLTFGPVNTYWYDGYQFNGQEVTSCSSGWKRQNCHGSVGFDCCVKISD